jgi:uncharacterized sulfatase
VNLPKNIMLLQCEDTGRHFGCYGDSYAVTPHIDALAQEGTLFTQAISHAPVCAPSRGGMVTGCYPWSIGNHHMRSRLKNPPRCFTHELVDHGVHVSWPTKLDFNFEPTEGWCSDEDNWWEKEAPAEPFFVYRNFAITHESRMFRELPEGAETHIPCPPEARHDPAKAPIPDCFPDIPELREQIVKYYDAVSAIDHQIGECLAWLEASGKAEETLVVLLSDHGRGLPREKRWCYNAGIHLPLIVRWPGELEGGTRCDELVAWVDIAPTLLSLAGVPIPSHYQGQVFLGPEKDTPREVAFAGRDRMDENFDKVRVARDARYLYIRNDTPGLPWAQHQPYMEKQPAVPIMRALHAEGKLTGAETAFFAPDKPAEELYDVDKDPWQLNNLAAKSDYRDVLQRLRTALEKNLSAFGDLGEKDESTLIEEGILTDRLEEYRERRAKTRNLPHEQILGPEVRPITLEEARPYMSA